MHLGLSAIEAGIACYMNRLQDDRPGNQGLICVAFHSVHTGSATHTTFYLQNAGDISPGGKDTGA